MKLRGVISVLTCMLIVLSGCSSKATFVGYDINNGTSNLDPQYYNDKTAKLVIVNIFEGLVVSDSQGELHPGVAKSWSVSDDGLTYSFVLRTNSFWKETKTTKQAAVTADDFRFAFERIFSTAAPSPYAYDYSNILFATEIIDGRAPMKNLGVSAESDTELTIALRQPDPNFLQKLAHPAASPCNRAFFEETKGRYGLKSDLVLGNGPFRLTRWEDNRITLAKNEGYSGQTAVTLDSVDLYIARDDKQDRFKDNRTQVLKITHENLADFNAKKYTVQAFDDNIWCLAFNQDADYWQTLQFREATLLAVDKTTLNIPSGDAFTPVNSIFSGSVKVGEQAIVDQHQLPPSYDPQQAVYKYNMALAIASSRQVLAANIYIPKGEHKAILEPIQQSWKDTLNLYYSFTEVPREDLEVKLRAGDFDIILMPISANEATPALLLEQFESSSKKNYVHYQSAVYDIGYKKMLAAKAGEEQVSSAVALANRLQKDAVLMPLYIEKGYYVFRDSAAAIDIYTSEDIIRFHKAETA